MGAWACELAALRHDDQAEHLCQEEGCTCWGRSRSSCGLQFCPLPTGCPGGPGDGGLAVSLQKARRRNAVWPKEQREAPSVPPTLSLTGMKTPRGLPPGLPLLPSAQGVLQGRELSHLKPVPEKENQASPAALLPPSPRSPPETRRPLTLPLGHRGHRLSLPAVPAFPRNGKNPAPGGSRRSSTSQRPLRLVIPQLPRIPALGTEVPGCLERSPMKSEVEKGKQHNWKARQLAGRRGGGAVWVAQPSHILCRASKRGGDGGGRTVLASSGELFNFGPRAAGVYCLEATANSQGCQGQRLTEEAALPAFAEWPGIPCWSPTHGLPQTCPAKLSGPVKIRPAWAVTEWLRKMLCERDGQGLLQGKGKTHRERD